MRKWVSVLLALALCSVPDGSALADHGGECIYVAGERIGIGCSLADFQLIDLKQRAELAWMMGDQQRYTELREQQKELFDAIAGDPERAHYLHVTAETTMSDIRGLSFAKVGDNVRYVTAPGPNGAGHRLIIFDLKDRPVKVTASACTSTAKFYVNHGLMWLWGIAAGWGVGGGASGTVLKLATGGKVVLNASQTAFGDGIAMYLAGARLSMVPNDGDCEYLVDILDNPNGKGERHLYRNRVVIAKDGTLSPTEWTDGVYWKDMGAVPQDENGEYIW